MTKIKCFFCLFFLILASGFLSAQENFAFQKHFRKAKIPFKLINNLVFIPIKINGVELNFLLDSGVEETILFSLEETKGLQFFNSQKIMLRGLGSNQSVEGLKSTNNQLETHGLLSKEHLVYVILDQSFNISSHIGIPVNGIIGYQFFKDNVIEIDYKKKKIYVYDNIEKIKPRKLQNFETIPITIERAKPYIIANLWLNGVLKKSKLLIDIGNSDAIWLFQNDSLQLPAKKIEDFLGKGFSGDVLGYRAKIDAFSIGDFMFKDPISAFPDSTSIQNVKMVVNRVGSVGGEILHRFTTILDYRNQVIYLKKNANYENPFQYNHSGITIQHNGLQWVEETVGLRSPTSTVYTNDDEYKNQTANFKYEFKLKPIFEIANIRKNSAAEKVGLEQGDIVLSINNRAIHKFSLQQINEILKSDDEYISLQIKRKSQILNFKFQLENEL